MYHIFVQAWDNPKYQYRLIDEQIDSSSAENYMREKGTKLHTSCQCALTTQKAKKPSASQAACNAAWPVAGQERGLCPSTPLLPEYSQLESFFQLWDFPAQEKIMDLLNRSKTKMTKGQEQLCYEDRVRRLKLFSLEKRKLW